MARPKKGKEHPRPEIARDIQLLVAIGVQQERIGRLLKMSKETMHKHYSDELELGSDAANFVVGGKIFEAAKRGEQWACTLWAVRRMGWKETNTTELTGKDGGAIQQELKADEAAKAFLNEFARLKAASAAPHAVAGGGASQPDTAGG